MGEGQMGWERGHQVQVVELDSDGTEGRLGQGDGIGAAADAADQQESTETWPVAMTMPTLFFLKRAGELRINIVRRKRGWGRGVKSPKTKNVTGLKGL